MGVDSSFSRQVAGNGFHGEEGHHARLILWPWNGNLWDSHSPRASPPCAAATKLLWLKRHEPDVFAQVATVLLPHNYINFWLTGEAVMEVRGCGRTSILSFVMRV